MLVSMDVTSLYTDIPQKEGINLVCKTGADPGFFLGGDAPLRNGVTYINKPHFFAEYQLYYKVIGYLREGCAPPAPSP